MRAAVVLVAAVALSACAWLVGEGEIPEQPVDVDAPIDYIQPEYGDPSPWVGRSMEELIRELGHPDAIYQARHTFADYDAGLPAVTLVYVTEDLYIDAYVVDLRTKIIIKFHRR